MTLNSFWVKQHLNVTKVKKKKKITCLVNVSQEHRDGAAEGRRGGDGGRRRAGVTARSTAGGTESGGK